MNVLKALFTTWVGLGHTGHVIDILIRGHCGLLERAFGLLRGIQACLGGRNGAASAVWSNAWVSASRADCRVPTMLYFIARMRLLKLLLVYLGAVSYVLANFFLRVTMIHQVI